MGTTSLEVVPNQVMKLKLNTTLHMWPRGVHPELEGRVHYHDAETGFISPFRKKKHPELEIKTDH
jgi:hypothetical protein